MRWSVALPYADRGSEFSRPDIVSRIAASLEAADVDACWITDHPFPLIDASGTGHQSLDIFTLGGYLAAAADRLTIHLNLVVMPYRNPFLVARAVSTLDHLAGGRLVVGVGAGYMRAEFEALGADFAGRSALVDEGLLAMKAAWTGQPVHAATKAWRSQGNSMTPPPFTTPHPRIWRGGNSPHAMLSAARLCDGWSPLETPGTLAESARTTAISSFDDLRRQISRIRILEESEGRRKPPLEICFVRPRTEWLTSSDEPVIEALVELREIGIDWLAITLPGSTTAEFTEAVDRFAGLGLEHSALYKFPSVALIKAHRNSRIYHLGTL